METSSGSLRLVKRGGGTDGDLRFGDTQEGPLDVVGELLRGTKTGSGNSQIKDLSTTLLGSFSIHSSTVRSGVLGYLPK